MKVIRDFRLES